MKPLDSSARPSTPELDVHLTENVPVPMRDGVRLATDVYRPARDGRPLADRRPVLLHRTPYNKVETEATSGECRYFAARGYVVVNQDCRGCFGSEGDVNFLIPEAEDGATPSPGSASRRGATARWAPSAPRGPAGPRPPWPRWGPRGSPPWCRT